MKITVALRAHLVSKGWSKADDAEADVKSVALAKLGTGEITLGEIAELTKEAPPAGHATLAAFQKSLADMQAATQKSFELLTSEIVNLKGVKKADAIDPAVVEARLMEHATKSAARSNEANSEGSNNTGRGRVSPEELLAKAHNTESSINGGVRVEVIKAADRYESTRKSLSYPDRDGMGHVHKYAGRQVFHQGRQIESRSQRDKAVIQAWLKYTLLRQGMSIPAMKMTAHDIDLVQWSIRNSEFVGGYGGDPDSANGCTHQVNRRKLTDYEVRMFDPEMWTKAPLIDDSTSGGSDLVPVEFDDAVITTPLLYGQLYPFVETIDIARGSHIQGGSIGNPTFSYTAEGSAVSPFDATAYVGDFNNTIYPAVGAMQIGRDFQQDSPANIGQLVMDAFGRAAMNWLDGVIATGNGTNQPQGIFTFATPINVVPENPVTGPITVADYEALLWAIPLEYQTEAGGNVVFLGNQTTYSRTRGIPVGPDDQRRVFGLDERDRTIMGVPYKINSGISNAQLAAVNLGGYRLYRRLGMTTVVERTGQTLQLANMDLILCRMRWAGKMKLPNYVSVISSLQS